MRKRIFALAVVMICLSILASTTIAYFTDIGTARNVITTGGIEIEVVEQQQIGDNLQPYENPKIPVMPGTEISKIVSVLCVQQKAWIRANYVITVFDADNQVMEIPADELARIILISPDTNTWTQVDGWWYYNTAVETGATTKPLFEKVAFSGIDMDNRYQNCTVIIDIQAQAVQADNNGESVWEALGWQ